MDNATAIPGQATQDDNATESGNLVRNVLIAAAAVVIVGLLFLLFIVRRRTGKSPTRGREIADSSLGDASVARDRRSNSPTPPPAHAEPRGERPEVPVPTIADSSEGQAAPGRESLFLDDAETWRRAKFFFPGLLNDTSLANVIAKYMHPKFGSLPDATTAIQVELWEDLSTKILDLSTPETDSAKMRRWEDLNKKENAAEFCVALGMNEAAVRLRFELIKNLEEELPLQTDKIPILHSIVHLIDTIHVNNPFGGEGDIDGNIKAGYRNTEWLSYLGVHWEKGQLASQVTGVKNKTEREIPGRNGFFVHGTTGLDLKKIWEAKGELVKSNSTAKLPHDFGSGFYCFKDEISWALSFAVSRCWPVGRDEEGLATVKSCNPAIVLFPKHNHTSLSNEKRTKMISGPPMGRRELKALEDEMEEEKYTNFVKCRKQWENDKELGFWKDIVKLSLIYQVTPSSLAAYLVVYGRMHSCEEKDKPIDQKVPVGDPENWTQYCFRNVAPLGTERLFIEFNIDWTAWMGNTTREYKKVREGFMRFRPTF